MNNPEQAMGALVVQWLEYQRYTVYQEVLHKGAVADIVADVNGYGWVIEVKKSLSIRLLEQARAWQRDGARRVSIAVPECHQAVAGRCFAEEICRLFGIGVITVYRSFADESIRPRFNRAKGVSSDILDFCHEGHRGAARAGSAGGGHWTPYSQTIKEVVRFLTGKSWTPIKQIIDGVQHHYRSNATAMSCLRKWLQAVERDRFESRILGRRIEFRLRKAAEAAGGSEP